MRCDVGELFSHFDGWMGYGNSEGRIVGEQGTGGGGGGCRPFFFLPSRVSGEGDGGWVVGQLYGRYRLFGVVSRYDAMRCRASKMVLDIVREGVLDRGLQSTGAGSMLFASVLFGEMWWAIEGERERGMGMGI